MNFVSQYVSSSEGWGASGNFDFSKQLMPLNTDYLLCQILQDRLLTPLYQPIVDIQNADIFGFEALIRGPVNTPLYFPLDLFAVARQHDLMHEMEHLSRQVVLQQYAEINTSKKLFINLSPDMLMRSRPDKGETIVFIHQLGLTPKDVIIEITEQSPSLDYAALKVAVESYRSMGFEIAMDDLGEGFSSLRLWSEIQPNYVKIDKHFIRNIHTDQVKFEFVRSIQQIAQNSGAKVVAEGIETKEELVVVKDLKIAYGQGYFFGKPEAHLIKKIPDIAKNILRKNAIYIYQNSTISFDHKSNVNKLLKYVQPAKPTATNNEIIKLFEADSSIHVLPVVDGDKPIGLTSRYTMIDNLVRPFRRELYGKRLCSDTFMDRNPLIVEKSISLKALSDIITGMEPHHLANGFIITDNGRYLGMGSGHDLLREITQMQLNAARYANPITMLPGNVPISEQIDRLLDSGLTFHVCYFDLDSFKPFNDIYGFSRGDDVIKYTANLLIQHVEKEYDFVGHIGGDDFIIIFQSEDWKLRCQTMLEVLQREMPNFYDECDKKAGGIQSEDRRGNKMLYPFVSLSIGAVSVKPNRYKSQQEISSAVTQAKKQAKKISGNSFFAERRLKN